MTVRVMGRGMGKLKGSSFPQYPQPKGFHAPPNLFSMLVEGSQPICPSQNHLAVDQALQRRERVRCVSSTSRPESIGALVNQLHEFMIASALAVAFEGILKANLCNSFMHSPTLLIDMGLSILFTHSS